MKKILFSSLLVASALFADTLVSVNELPKSALEFIKTHYSSATVSKVEKDWNSYEVKLSNGVEIDFKTNGDLKEIDGKYTPIPDTVLSNVLAKAKQSQNGAKLMELEKKSNGYELKFSNNMEVYIDDKGEILSSKLDD